MKSKRTIEGSYYISYYEYGMSDTVVKFAKALPVINVLLHLAAGVLYGIFSTPYPYSYRYFPTLIGITISAILTTLIFVFVKEHLKGIYTLTKFAEVQTKEIMAQNDYLQDCFNQLKNEK